jgi:hypothetical protein
MAEIMRKAQEIGAHGIDFTKGTAAGLVLGAIIEDAIPVENVSADFFRFLAQFLNGNTKCSAQVREGAFNPFHVSGN